MNKNNKELKKVMTSRQRFILKDMAAFIVFGLNNGMTFDSVLGSLSHDIGGIVRKERCFLPRSNGFAKSTGLTVVR